MAIVKMKRLRLVGLTPQREELLQALQHLGCVEISEPEERPDDPAWATLVRAGDSALASRRDQVTDLSAALTTLNKHVKSKGGGLLTPLPQVAEEALFSPEAADTAAQAAEIISSSQARLEAIRVEEGKLRAQRKALAPWSGLDVPLDVENTRRVSYTFGSVPARSDPAALEAGLGEITELCQLVWAEREGDARYVLVICHKRAERGAFAYLKGVGFTPANLRGWQGTAAENVAAIDGALADLARQREEAEAALTAQGAQRESLELGIDRSRQDIARSEAHGRLMESAHTFFLEGWLPADEEERLGQALEGLGCAWETADPTPEEYPKVPIKLKNNPVTASMSPITEMYSMPAYGSVDPNPLMAPFFILFFGFMMNDIAYGLLMVLGTALYLKLKRPKEGTRNMMMLFLLCGVSSIFWGCLTGSFFGDFFPQLFKLLDPDSTFVWFWPPLFNPVNDTIMVMIGSMVLGAIQVFTGMAISVVEKVRKADPLDAVFDEISWWIVIGAAAWAILGGGTPALALLVVGILMLVVGGTRNEKGFFGKAAGAIGIVYNGVSGFFSDILSYLRLMALMMAGSIIAQVFNTLGSVFGLVPFLVVAFIGNMLNLVLNLLGCYVHTLRLQCLEFFGRFYKDGGKIFKPLNVDTQYVDII